LWVRNTLSKLRADIEWWKEKAHKVESGESNVWIRRYDSIDGRIPLPPDSRVVFSDGDGGTIEVHPGEGKQTVISAQGKYNERLVIVPAASNTFYVMHRNLEDDDGA